MPSPSRLEAFLSEPRNVIVAGIRKDGRPHLSPNWFFWDGDKFYVSTTRKRVKYHVFRRDPRVELVVDDATGHRYVQTGGTVEIREDVPAELSPLSRHPGETRPPGPVRQSAGRRANRRRPRAARDHACRPAVDMDRRRAGLSPA